MAPTNEPDEARSLRDVLGRIWATRGSWSLAIFCGLLILGYLLFWVFMIWGSVLQNKADSRCSASCAAIGWYPRETTEQGCICERDGAVKLVPPLGKRKESR